MNNVAIHDYMARIVRQLLPTLFYYGTSLYLSIQSFCISSIHGGQTQVVRLQGGNRYDPMDGGGRTASGTTVESRAGSGDREQRRDEYMEVRGRPRQEQLIEQLSKT